MTLSAKAICEVRRAPSGAVAATSFALGFLVLLSVAPLSAQNAKSLIDLLTNPQAQDLPPLVRAASDGAMLAGKPIVPTLPRVTLTAHRGEKLAPTDPQRLAAASPDIVVPARIEATRLAAHFLTTENAADRAVLTDIFAGVIPEDFKHLEPAANAPKVDFLKPGLLSFAAVAMSQPPAPLAEAASVLAASPILAAMPSNEGIKFPDDLLFVPPPPIKLVAVKPPTLAIVTQDLTPLRAVTQGFTPLPAVTEGFAALPAVTQGLTPLTQVPSAKSLAAVSPPTIKGQVVEPLPDVTAPAVVTPEVVVPTDLPVAVVPDLTGDALDRALQAELKRLNCYSGTVDGSFGAGSLGALDLFFQTTALVRASTDPTQAVLNQLKAVADNVCPSPYVAVVQQTDVTQKTKPSTTKPATTKPATTKAVTTKPATSKPATTKPATTKAATTKPATTKPAVTKPATTKVDPCLKNPAGCTSFGG